MRNLLVGADPEVFVQDIETKEICSSIDILPGTKEDPYKTKHGYVHRDNVLAEINVKPANNPTDFCKNVQNVLCDLKELLKERGKTYSVTTSHELHEKYISHYMAKRFSCDPDFNVWRLEDPPRIINSEDAGSLRTAGGHIHLGFPEEINMDNQLRVVKSCELYIGLPSVIMDKDKKRRSLYGSSGSFREKEYGIEYRVPSNFWLKEYYYMQWIFKAASNAWANRYEVDYLNEEQCKEIQHTINNNDIKNAKKLCNEYGISYVEE